MTYTVHVDAEGRITLPSDVLQARHFVPGTALELDVDLHGTDRFLLRPAPRVVGLREVEGVLMVDDDTPVTTADSLHELDDIRMRSLPEDMYPTNVSEDAH